MPHCAHPGCPVLVARGRCVAHARTWDQARPHVEARAWYHTARWSRLRQRVLLDAAFTCAQCRRVQARLEVDHIVKHEGLARRFWDRTNLQALCPTCHARKTKAGA